MSRIPRQLELADRRWGARLHQGGRPVGPNPRVRHRPRERFAKPLPCHVTLKVRRDVPSLRSARLVRELEASFARGCERGEFRVVHYTLQANHAHLVIEARSPDALGRGMKAIGARLARAVNRVFRRRGPVLADRYHLQVLRSPKQVRAALRYVLLNARKHARRLRSPVDTLVDPASSGFWFDGWRTEPLAEPAWFRRWRARPPPVAGPRGWLLSRGWRRHGLIDPAEVPGREAPAPRERRTEGL